jgi:PTS system galactitol-specific IIA component
MNNVELVTISGHANNWEETIKLCGEELIKKDYVESSFIDGCIAREKEYPTGLPVEIPVAIPHSNSMGIKKDCLCFLRLDNPVKFNRMDLSEDFIKAQLIFNIAIKGHNDHLEFLQKLISTIQNKEVMSKCLNLSIEDINQLLNKLINN